MRNPKISTYFLKTFKDFYINALNKDDPEKITSPVHKQRFIHNKPFHKMPYQALPTKKQAFNFDFLTDTLLKLKQNFKDINN